MWRGEGTRWRTAAAVALMALLAGAVLALGGPSGAQSLAPSVEVTGAAVCLPPADASAWQITWTITNTTSGEVTTTTSTTGGGPGAVTPATLVGPPEPGAIALIGGEVSGAWTGPVLIPPGYQLQQGELFRVDTGPVPNTVVGEVTLTVRWWTEQTGDVTSTATVGLDGSCVAPGMVAGAVDASPVLTG